MRALEFTAHTEQDTDRFGAALASALAAQPAAGTTIALTGTLGAGKTRLVQAIAAAWGVPREQVVSPTFVLCQQYEGQLDGQLSGQRTIQHLDAYRLRDADDLRELGLEELIATADLTIIEWADRVPAALPSNHLRIEIDVVGPTSRLFRVQERSQAAGSFSRHLHTLLPDAKIVYQ